MITLDYRLGGLVKNDHNFDNVIIEWPLRSFHTFSGGGVMAMGVVCFCFLAGLPSIFLKFL